MKSMLPSRDEYADPYHRYVQLVTEDDIVEAMAEQSAETQRVLTRIDEKTSLHRYAEGKWSIRELVGHVVDSERIFSYRALAIARGEQAGLPGFDENEYAKNANFDSWTLAELAESYALVRKTNIIFFRNLDEETWARRGTASGWPVTVRALAYATLGHERHHLGVLRDKYGV
ncbi:MAG TPA: DinB family protein [Thermoanaerobaculia bacterium]|jgi:uncharacterized damage-inducible protein DinB